MTSSNKGWHQNRSCFCKFLHFSQFFYHLLFSVWIGSGFDLEIREYPSDWSKI